ncbi:tail fiber domain-containing protein (plasmid) [Diaphorobacter sp. HDW4B]|uniref:tail fiber domain-containing protein n=1 Tax=Diaphorobacter sp. HDW4B TaxID=2714925 RepID=UPI00140C9EEA|nr:tail fiber domain-containing protein [Diaphorobacter sp. HDW4B]QIL74283.1 tail fiber domain-containing protein [Diaphorobacter sp. HDW4B]
MSYHPHVLTSIQIRPQGRSPALLKLTGTLAALMMLGGLPMQASFAQASNSASTTGLSTSPLTVSTTLTSSHLTWKASAAHGSATLRLVRSDGQWLRDMALPSDSLTLSAQDNALPDGQYTFELTLAPALATRRQRADDDNGASATANPPMGATQSGTATVRDGRFVLPTLEPTNGTAVAKTTPFAKDVVVADDSIVQANMCVGFDCGSGGGETFGSDMLRLKENNLRIKFAETRVAPDPTREWQIIANESNSGGANFLGIDDVTGVLGPIRWMAGAPADSLMVDAQGRLGVRTATPAQAVQMSTADTPAIRLEQNNTTGFTAQTWDVAGNEANFFVRDLNQGSLLSLRIRPGAPQSSVDIAGNGFVGLGTPRPSAALHVRRVDGHSNVHIANTTTANTGPLVELQNKGPVVAAFLRGSSTTRWTATADTGDFRFAGDSGTTALAVQANGDLVVPGILSQGSSRTLKHDIVPVATHAILQSVQQLPVYAWRYLSDQNSSVHLGPMAEDVHQATQLGESPRRLAPSDVASLAAAAVQALNQQLAVRDAELSTLMRRFLELESRLSGQVRSQP